MHKYIWLQAAEWVQTGKSQDVTTEPQQRMEQHGQVTTYLAYLHICMMPTIVYLPTYHGCLGGTNTRRTTQITTNAFSGMQETHTGG